MIEFIARVKCDRPGCSATSDHPVFSRIASNCNEVELEADYPVGTWHELFDVFKGRWVECPACYADPDRFRRAGQP